MAGDRYLRPISKRFTGGTSVADAFGRGVVDGNNFDAIRLFAALMVLWEHAFLLSIERNPTDILGKISHGQTGYGDLGIAIFFVLSGFLIATSWMRRPDVVVFARNRAMRIMPALMTVVLASVFIIGPLMTSLQARDYFSDSQTWRYLLNILFLYRNDALPGVFETAPYAPVFNGPLWTLKFEVICYSLLAVLGAARLLTARGCLAMIAGCMALSIFVGSSVDSLTDNFLRQLSTMAPWFFGGAFFAVAGDRIRLNAASATLCVVALALALLFGGFNQIFGLAGTYLVLFAGFAALGALRNAGRFGDFSYGVYIWSWPIQQIIAIHIAPSPAIVLAISAPASLAVAYLSWRIIEKPALRLKSNSALAHGRRQPLFRRAAT